MDDSNKIKDEIILGLKTILPDGMIEPIIISGSGGRVCIRIIDDIYITVYDEYIDISEDKHDKYPYRYNHDDIEGVINCLKEIIKNSTTIKIFEYHTKRHNELKSMMESILLKLQVLEDIIEYHPDGDKAKELKEDFNKLSESFN